jgi:hypothetical protein
MLHVRSCCIQLSEKTWMWRGRILFNILLVNVENVTIMDPSLHQELSVEERALDLLRELMEQSKFAFYGISLPSLLREGIEDLLAEVDGDSAGNDDAGNNDSA